MFCRAKNQADAAAVGMTDQNEPLAGDEASITSVWQFIQGCFVEIVVGPGLVER